MKKIKLIAVRKSKGYSQEKIAELMFMSPSNYSRREKGQTKILAEEWKKLCEILEVSIDNIYEPDETKVFKTETAEHQVYMIPVLLWEMQKNYIRELENELALLKVKLS